MLTSGDPDGIAITAPERSPLSRRALAAQMDATIASLRALGVGRNDRVAIVLPNGPEMAAAFVAIACGATTAPLNPAYRQEEFDFYLSDLNAKALVIQDGMESPARDVAKARGIPIVRLVSGAHAGDFTLEADLAGIPAAAGPAARRGDIALVLHTSGTTSRPKIVPLTHTNLTASAYHIGEHAFPARGRCLPQHHAAVPHPRPDRRHAFQPRGGRQRGLHARLQCPEILCLGR